MSSLREAAENTPSAVLKQLVDKLKRDLSEKEKRSRAMAKAVAELKRELMEQAERAPVKKKEKEEEEEEEEETEAGRRTVAGLKRRVEELTSR